MGRKKTDHPRLYQDRDTLYKLYIEQGMNSREVAEELDCSSPTVLKWLGKFDIPIESATRDRLPYYATSTHGYEYYQHNLEGEKLTVQVHRLAAVAWFGWDAVSSNLVHHRDPESKGRPGIPWDNREEILVPISRSEHQRLHDLERHHSKSYFDSHL